MVIHNQIDIDEQEQLPVQEEIDATFMNQILARESIAEDDMENSKLYIE